MLRIVDVDDVRHARCHLLGLEVHPSPMRNRFTYESRTARGKISRETRQEIFSRDGFVCQYCGHAFPADVLTIDHLVPLAGGGHDEKTNYVTACRPCNERKAALPLVEFAASLGLTIEHLPVHGDPVIDNPALPIAIRLIRKRVFDRIRAGALTVTGRSAQKKIEKEYRRAFWQTEEGRQLELTFPSLPGHVRAMIPEILTIAKDRREYLLLVELAKSANTRSLIGDILRPESDVEALVRRVFTKTNDMALKKRLGFALKRFESGLRDAQP